MLAGWNIDDVCLVIAGPPSECTDGGDCESEPTSGCCSSSGTPAGSLALSLMTFGLVLRRRHRARR